MKRLVRMTAICALIFGGGFCSLARGAMSPSVHFSSPLAAVTRATTEGRLNDVIQAALTRQLFHESGTFAPRFNAAGEIQVDLVYSANNRPPNLDSLKALGATGLSVAPLMHTVEVWLPAANLGRLAELGWVQDAHVPQYALSNYATPPGGETRGSPVDSAGASLMGASAFTAATGANGSGITVGIINAGDAGLSQSEGLGDLPPSVWQDPNYPGNSDGEGTAMMEIVHSLAPGANLAFCGPQTTVEFLNCLTDLSQHGAQVIVDDLAFPATAYFTEDSDVVAVQQWQAQNSSVRLVTAAGNFAQSFWSGLYTSSAINPITVNGVTYNQAQNFGTSTNVNFYDTITVQVNDTIEYILEWADSWVPTAQITGNTPDDPNDYDIVLYDANGNILACNQGATSDATGCTQPGAAASATPGVEPAIGNTWTNTTGAVVTVNLAIFLRAGAPSNDLKLFVASTQSCPVTLSPVTPSDSIVSHAVLPYPAEISVGAVNAPAALQGNYGVELFSSEGPVSLPLLTSTPIQKPDFAGVDGVSISGSGGFPPAACGFPAPNPPVYYGTSAAAPHVAALIALLESSGYSSSQVYGVLQQYAKPISDPNVANGSGDPNGLSGYGLAYIGNTPSGQPAQNSGGGSSGGGKSGGGGGLGWLSLAVLGLLAERRSRR